MIRLQYQLISTKYTRVSTYILKLGKDCYNLEKKGLKRRVGKKENYTFDDWYASKRNTTWKGFSKRALKEREQYEGEESLQIKNDDDG